MIDTLAGTFLGNNVDRSARQPEPAAARTIGGQILVASAEQARERYIWPAHAAFVRARGDAVRARVRLGWLAIECARQLGMSLRAFADEAQIHRTTYWRCVRVARAVAGAAGEIDQGRVQRLRDAVLGTTDPALQPLRAAAARPADQWSRRVWERVVAVADSADGHRIGGRIGRRIAQTRTTPAALSLGERAEHRTSPAALSLGERAEHRTTPAALPMGERAMETDPSAAPARGQADYSGGHEPIQAHTVAAAPPQSPGAAVSGRERAAIAPGPGAPPRPVQLTLDSVYAEARAAAEQVRAVLAGIEAGIEQALRRGDAEGLRALADRCRGIAGAGGRGRTVEWASAG